MVKISLPAVFGLFFYGYSFGQNAIRKDLINVKDDVVTSIESSVLYDNANNFVELANHANKKQLENAKGVLYNIGEGFECTPAAHGKDHFGNEYVRIALGYVGKCNPYSVIQQAVFDDARGIILYEDTKNNAELKKKVKNELKNKKVGIPVYVVDSNIGSFLSRQVLEMDLDNNFKDNTDNKRAVFVSLIGSPNTGGKGLRTAMIVVFTILGAGVLISLFLYLKKRHQKRLYISGKIEKPSRGRRRRTLPESIIKNMETFTLSQEVISKLTSNNNHTPTLLFSPTSGSKTASNVSYTKGMRHLSTCAICIDDFVAGVKVRKLPCTHFFHTECIDPWLQKQSALCPVCKYDTRMLMSVDDYECEDFNAAPLLEDGGIEKEVGMGYYLNRLYTTALGKSGGKNKKNKNTIPVRRVSFERPKFATHHRTIRVEKPTDNI